MHKETVFCTACDQPIPESQALALFARPKEADKSPAGLTGLRNRGNKCYMLTAVQCIVHTPSIRQFFDNTFIPEYLDSRPAELRQLLTAFANLLQTIWKGSSRFLQPLDFQSAINEALPTFADRSQHDSEEFLKCFLDKLHDGLKHEYKLGHWRSIVTDTFQSRLKSTIICKECLHRHERVEEFLDLGLAIPKSQELEGLDEYSSLVPISERVKEASERKSVWGKLRGLFNSDQSYITLYHCLLNFFLPEELSSHNKFSCQQCRNECEVRKEYKIVDPPNVLMIVLKRFSFLEASAKVSTYVKCEPKIDLRAFMDRPEQCSYKLYGVIQHKGKQNSGHYLAYWKHEQTKNWYEFNDEQVRQVSESHVLNTEAYVLFYERVRPVLPPVLLEEPTAVVPTYWLHKWYSLADPGRIFQEYLLCRHQKLGSLFSLAEFTMIAKVKALELFGQYSADSDLLDSIEPCVECTEQFRSVEERVQQELEVMKQLNEIRPFEGPWFLVSSKWLQKWELFMRHPSDTVDEPGPVNNQELLDDGQPKEGLVKLDDYRGVNRHVWAALMCLYGGGPALPRRSLNIYEEPCVLFECSTPDLDSDIHFTLNRIKYPD